MTIENPLIQEGAYNTVGVDALQQVDESQKELLLQYPTVYIVNDAVGEQYSVYVGETNNIVNRTKQHLVEDRDDWVAFNQSTTAKMLVIGHAHFNKSMTLDIENKMRLYLTGVAQVHRINNRRGNPQGHYYTSDEVNEVFDSIWKTLNRKNSSLFPDRNEVEKSALFKSSPFHQLTDEQEENKDLLLLRIIEAVNRNLSEQLVMVEGAAGTGKTVLLSSLFFQLLNEIQSQDNPVLKDLNVALLVNHDEQIKVYQSIADKLGQEKAAIAKPNSFIGQSLKNHQKYDVVIVDEGHLLATRNGQAFPKRYGQTHLEVLQRIAKVVVLVYDPQQILTTEQHLSPKKIAEMRDTAASQNNLIELTQQMRIDASQATIDWINSFVQGREVEVIPDDDGYDLRIFDDVEKMYTAIKERAADEKSHLSRMLATYDWPWKHDGKEYDVQIGDWKLPWNYYLTSDKDHIAWAENPVSIQEVGSTFTIQGFDLNYAGVIIGNSVQYRDGEVVFNPANSYSKKAKQVPKNGDEDASVVPYQNLNNELNVLLSRGVNGLYIYAEDEALRNKLLEMAGDYIIGTN